MVGGGGEAVFESKTDPINGGRRRIREREVFIYGKGVEQGEVMRCLGLVRILGKEGVEQPLRGRG